ncbi:MAG: hypothetical protein SGILL_001480 [Bacillariaceae sp.]
MATLESLKLICHSLNRSPRQWWKSSETIGSIQSMLGEQQHDDSDHGHDDDGDDKSSGGSSHEDKNESDDDEGEMIDLQAGSDGSEHRFTPRPTNNNNDDLSIDSDDSIWNESKNR